MDRATLLAQLEAARRRLEISQRLVADQRNVITGLRSIGNETSLAEATLASLLITD
jgi:hypothetical protein